jgi:hypothetical protein
MTDTGSNETVAERWLKEKRERESALKNPLQERRPAVRDDAAEQPTQTRGEPC